MSYADGIEALHDEIPLFPVEFPQALIVVKTELQTGLRPLPEGDWER